MILDPNYSLSSERDHAQATVHAHLMHDELVGAVRVFIALGGGGGQSQRLPQCKGMFVQGIRRFRGFIAAASVLEHWIGLGSGRIFRFK